MPDGAARLRFRCTSPDASGLLIDSVAAEGSVQSELDAFQTLTNCRKAIFQRNANPQMIAERALLDVRSAVQAPA